MRIEKTIELRDGVKVVIRELTPKILRNFLTQLDKFQDFPLKEILSKYLGEVINSLGDCVEIQGVNWEELAFSEIEQIVQAFQEVNKSFFGLMALTSFLPAEGVISENKSSKITSKEPASS